MVMEGRNAEIIAKRAKNSGFYCTEKLTKNYGERIRKNVEMRHQTLSLGEELSVSLYLLAGTKGKVAAGWDTGVLAATMQGKPKVQRAIYPVRLKGPNVC